MRLTALAEQPADSKEKTADALSAEGEVMFGVVAPKRMVSREVLNRLQISASWSSDTRR